MYCGAGSGVGAGGVGSGAGVGEDVSFGGVGGMMPDGFSAHEQSARSNAASVFFMKTYEEVPLKCLAYQFLESFQEGLEIFSARATVLFMRVLFFPARAEKN